MKTDRLGDGRTMVLRVRSTMRGDLALKTARLCDVAMARVSVSVTTNGYQIKEGDLLYPLVPCPLKSGKGFASGGLSKSSSF